MEEKKDWILNNIHLKEGGLEDLLFEYADAVIEDYQGRIEDEETLTSVSVSKKIDEEVYNLVQQELDRAREEEFEKGVIKGRLEALPITIEEVNKARKGAKKGESKKLYQSISKELYKLYSDIENLGDLRDEVYDLSDKYEQLSKLTTK